MQAYSDPKRETDPYALPDVEIFHSSDYPPQDGRVEEWRDLDQDPEAEPEDGWRAPRTPHPISRNCPCDVCDAWFRQHGDEEE